MTDIKDRLVSLAKEYQELDKEAFICRLGENQVQLLKGSWEQLFSDETPQYYAIAESNYFIKYVKYDGIKFICLLKQEEYENEKV